MDRKKIEKNLVEVAKDIFIAFAVVAIIMLVLWAYCGIWPPMVVVESGSMSRFDDRSVLGVIDTGDMVFVKTVNGVGDVRTYVDGEATGYSKFGSYGDVVIYRPNGQTDRTPIIHRAVVWIDVNTSMVNPNFNGIDYQNYSFDIPSLGLYGTTDDIHLEEYGYWEEDVNISLSLESGLLWYYSNLGLLPHGGYITMGDHNVPAYDQPLSGSYEPVLPEWIVGKAWGEIPWFGLVKLKVTGANVDGVPQNSWRNLFITVFLLLFVPFLMDLILPKLRKRRLERKKEGDGVSAGEASETAAGSLPERGNDGAMDPGGKDIGPEETHPAPVGGPTKEKVVIIKEIVRIPCPHCRILVENTEVKCPNCGAPIR